MRKRNPKGQALVEGVIALVLITGATIGALLLLANTAIAFYFKDKLSSCSNQAAQFAFTLPAGSNLEQETTKFANFFLPQIGVKPNNLIVKARTDTFQGKPAVFVDITNTFPLFGNLTFLPGTVSLQDSGGAISPTIAVAGAGPEGPQGPPGPPGTASPGGLPAPASLVLAGGLPIAGSVAQLAGGVLMPAYTPQQQADIINKLQSQRGTTGTLQSLGSLSAVNMFGRGGADLSTESF
jgi:hypothetical protein